MARESSKRNETRSSSTRGVRRAAPAPPVEISDLAAIIILLIVAAIFFSGHLFGGSFLWEDFAEFVYPNEVFAARSFAAGILPFWNPYTFNGMPFLADLQIGYFYPGNLLMYLLSGGHLGTWLAQFFVIIHYPIAMFGAWRLARGLGISQWGALFSGIAYGLSGMLVAHMIHPNMVEHLAWLPLVVHFFRRGIVEGSWRNALLGGLLLGLSFLAGHPQSVLYIVFYLFILTIVLLAIELRRDTPRRSLVVGAVCALVTVAAAVGIFAIQLLPSQELAGLSERATMTYEESLQGAMVPSQLLTLVVPKVFGVADAPRADVGTEPGKEIPFWLRSDVYYFWETAVYIGVVTLLLAVIGLASRSLGALGWFFGGMAVLGLLYGLGDSFFVHPILARLPLFNTFRSPVRLAMYLSLGGAVLAGAGLDSVLTGARDRTTALYVTGAIIVGIALMTVAGIIPGSLGVPEAIAGAIASTGVAPLLIGAAAVLVVWMRLHEKIPATATAALLVALGTVDLFVFGMMQNQSDRDPQATYEANDQQFAAFKVHPPDSLFRLRMRDDGAMLMQRNQGPYSGIMLFEGYNPLLLERRVPPAYSPEKAFDFMNIRYSVRADRTTGQAGIVERPTAYAHARMLYDVRVGSREQVLAMLKDSSIDFGRTVLLERQPGIATSGAGTGTARFTRYDASELELDVETDRPGILLLSEVWYPAWKVEIDGRPQELLTADYSLRGIAVPQGRHKIRLVYQSAAFAAGSWITIGTLVVTIAGIILTWRRRRVAAPATA